MGLVVDAAGFVHEEKRHSLKERAPRNDDLSSLRNLDA
jgi:hypothetical protein